MSVEQGGAPIAAVFVTDWTAYRRCPICRADTGEACRTRADRVVDGRPDGPARELPVEHGFRKRLAGR